MVPACPGKGYRLELLDQADVFGKTALGELKCVLGVLNLGFVAAHNRSLLYLDGHEQKGLGLVGEVRKIFLF